jgi:hypothetical protein
MNKYSGLNLPEQKNYEEAYNQALELAVNQVRAIENLEDMCNKSGSTLSLKDTHPAINLKYLNKIYNLSFPGITLAQSESNKSVETRDKILILHYLLRARGTPPSKKLIAFREFHEGSAYYPSYFKRSISPLIEYLGSKPEILLDVSREFGVSRSDYGDVSITIPAFERVPITYVLWKGDSEFAPNANILFDPNVLDYLPLEDVIVLCQTITWRLVNNYLSNEGKN